MKLNLNPLFWKLPACAFLIFCMISPVFGNPPDTLGKNKKPIVNKLDAGNVQGPGVTPPRSVVQPASLINKVSEVIGFAVDVNNTGIFTPEKGPKPYILTQNNEIDITITNPKDFLKSRPTDHTPLILYVDGFPLRGMNTDYFTGISSEYLNDQTKYWPDTATIPFAFTRDSTNEAAWNIMLKLTKWYKNKITFKMSLGWDGMFPLNVCPVKPMVNNSVDVVFFKRWVFWVFSGIYLIFLVVFAYYCYTSGLIRDPDLVNNLPGPYSLAQTQLAFWTVIIIGGFCYLWMLTGQADSINTSILLLLGISGSTTGTATFIDYYKKTALVNNAAAQQAPGSPPTAAPTTVKNHRTFIKDILSDGVNMSVQRTQTALWNLVLGLYFLWYVVTNKSMPDFNNTLLILAGVSSVLYVTSKPTENPPTNPTTPPLNTGQGPTPNPADPSNSAQHEF